MKDFNTSLIISISVLSVLLTGNVSAQLEEVIVTAQRRTEDLQSTPLSVATFAGDSLEDLGVNDPQQLAEFVPNLSMGDGTGRGAGNTQISIRGVNEARISPTLDPAVGIYIDDVYFGRPQTSFIKMLDVERVEVLRGPQGTLFGKNSTGGALRYITKRPEFDEVSGYVDATLGNYDRVDVKGAINIPLSDTVAIRVTGGSLDRDGYIDRLADGQTLGNEDSIFASAKLRWQPSEQLDINFGIDYSSRETDDGPTKLIDYHNLNGGFAGTGDATAGGPTAASPGSNATAAWNGYWGTTARVYDPVTPADLYTVGGEGMYPILDVDSIGLSLNIEYDFGNNFTLKSISGYREVNQFVHRDPDDQADAFTFFDDAVHSDTDFWSQELQLSGLHFDDRLNWVAGLYYSEEEPTRFAQENRDSRVTGVRGALFFTDTGAQTTDSFGVYGQGTYDVTDKLSLTAGVRYTEDKKNFNFIQVINWDAALVADGVNLGLAPLTIPAMGPGSQPCDPIPTGSCVKQPGVSGGDKFTEVTPRFAIEYQFNDDIMAYASASKGFKAGGTNDTVNDVDIPFAPETIWSYEGGIRSEFLNNRLRINATYFFMEYEGKHITVVGSTICDSRCTLNAGDAEIDGWEIETQYVANDFLSLHANFGILDAQWTDPVPGSGVTLDSDFSRAPDLSYVLGARFNLPLDMGGRLAASIDYSYKDDQESSPQDSTTLTIPSYDLLTARLKYVSADESWEASVFCSNCTDEKYITGGAAWAGATDNTIYPYKLSNVHPAYVSGGLNPAGTAPPGITMVNVGAPRFWGVDFRYNF
jgi:iron complex outermembrane receptor protein